MVEIQQRFLTALLLAPLCLSAQRFYPDDPLPREPRPRAAGKIKSRDINDYYDFFLNTFHEPGKKEQRRPAPAQAVNTLGEVPDNSWFTNRAGSHPMTIEELVRGPGDSHPPDRRAPWTVVSGKNEGVTPGLVIRDAAGRRYFLKFDPPENPEMASAADVIGSKFFYALGYNVPENYIVTFARAQLALDSKSTIKGENGRKRIMTERDLDAILAKISPPRDGQYRGMASLAVPGEPVGPHRYYGTRADDRNDIVPHENRRDQRGLFVFCAWLNHTDAKGKNSLDSVVEEDGVRFVKHFLIDFGDSMGSDSDEPKDARRGHVYVFEGKPAAAQAASLGFFVPGWMRARYPDIPAIGNFDYSTFDPPRWRSNYPNPAFDLRNPDDDFWAAKKVMAFSDAAIRAIVATGRYSDPRAVEWAAKCLIERRDRIGRAFFDAVLPLDNFRVRGGRLEFDDLAAQYGFRSARQYSIQWARFDNQSGAAAPITGAAASEVPRDSGYLRASIRADDPAKMVTVYLRAGQVVGIERSW